MSIGVRAHSNRSPRRLWLCRFSTLFYFIFLLLSLLFAAALLLVLWFISRRLYRGRARSKIDVEGWRESWDAGYSRVLTEGVRGAQFRKTRGIQTNPLGLYYTRDCLILTLFSLEFQGLSFVFFSYFSRTKILWLHSVLGEWKTNYWSGLVNQDREEIWGLIIWTRNWIFFTKSRMLSRGTFWTSRVKEKF